MEDFGIQRKKTHQVMIGDVAMGGGAPVVVQSMTDTDTENAEATAAQVLELAAAGSEIVRITVNTEKAAQTVPEIARILKEKGCDVPLVGDFHYNGHMLLAKYPECAKALAKFRINPGNVGFGQKRDTQFDQMVEKAIEYNKPVRIGVNWGSLDQQVLARLMDENGQLAQPRSAEAVQREAIIVSALESAKRAEELGLGQDKIVISCKVSRVQDLIAVYQELATRGDYCLHLGLTEAGMGSKGTVASTAALAVLLQQGIGDTIRISLTPEPGQKRSNEVIVGQQILQTMGIRSFMPMVTSCPGCGRTTSSYFRTLAKEIEEFLTAKMPVWREQYPQAAEMDVAVMGCIVNGPGESKNANIGISLPGKGESPAAPVFIDGEKVTTLRGDNIAREFKQLVENYVLQTYGEMLEKVSA